MNALRPVLVWPLVAAAIFATALASHSSMAADTEKTERTVSVSATGKAAAEPDLAHISAGVVTNADSAKEALKRNNEVMARLLDGLKSLGVAPKDIRTTIASVGPRYSQPRDGRPATIEGYHASNQVRLTVREIGRLGEVLAEAITLGANQINQITFVVSNAETLKDEARRQAMENARRQAELYAKAAGAQLGPALRIAETLDGMQPFDVAADAPQGFRRTVSVPIEPGTQNLEVEVRVVYALR